MQISWTDQTTNHVNFANLEVAKNAQALVGIGTTPTSLLLSFLHETTHHWTFSSPVGNAIAVIESSARRGAAQYVDTGATDEQQLLLDYIVSWVASKTLNAYSEGLAVAAEADSLSYKTPFMSGPFRSAIHAFAPPKGTDALLVGIGLDGLLLTTRENPGSIARKLNVYADTLSDNARGYLLGYMTVRSLLRTLWKVRPDLAEDSDLAISFLRSWIYDDWQLVDLLLERDVGELKLANSVNSYLYERLHTIYSVEKKDIDEYEEVQSGNPYQQGEEVRSAGYLHYQEARGVRGVERLKERIGELLKQREGELKSHPESKIRQLAETEWELLSTRSLVDLGECPIQLIAREDACDVLDLDGTILFRDLPIDHRADKGDGRLEICYDAESPWLQRLAVISTGNELVTVVPVGPRSRDGTYSIPRITLPRHVLRSILQSHRDDLSAVIHGGWFGVVANHIERQQAKTSTSVYLDTATHWIPDPLFPSAFQQLRDGGIRRVLGGNRQLAEVLAMIGAARQRMSIREYVDATLARYDYNTHDVDQLIEISSDIMPLVQQASNGFILTYV
jgi:hypothetical protein